MQARWMPTDIDEPVVEDVVVDRSGSSRPPSLPMMGAYMPMMTAGALAAAGRIGLFEQLATGPLTLSDLALSLGKNIVGVERLTDFLVALQYLDRRDELIGNAPETMRWFTSRGVIDYGSGLAWTADAWNIMDDLSDAIARGGPDQSLWQRMHLKPSLGEDFSRYMCAFAQHLAPDILSAVEIPQGASRLLDLGGSHGHHSMAFAKTYPELSAVIVDLESALTDTRGRIEQEGLDGRVSIRSGDVRDGDWGADYDVALYLSIAHNMSLEENEEIFRQLADVIRPGGVLVIHDYPRETTPALFETAFRLTLLVETGTRTYSYDELSKLLTLAGFSQLQLKVLAPAEKGALIIACR
jgi:SAM-dependent methyltransferase